MCWLRLLNRLRSTILKRLVAAVSMCGHHGTELSKLLGLLDLLRNASGIFILGFLLHP